ncbi:uncharacterized protein LOC143625352 [Bidens hawaiensis]|uniref:uncharacterized protein LOC143625352 n=1 Tax=Bidens hawaiensis TaxID=980011 RepID=UPI00404B8CBE
MKETDTIEEFVGKLAGFVSRYTSLGSNLEDEVLVRKLLDSVPKKYLQIVASIEQYSDLDTMPFEEAISRLKACEERIREQDETGDSGQNCDTLIDQYKGYSFFGKVEIKFSLFLNSGFC